MEPAVEHNPYLAGSFAPVHDESAYALTELLSGEVPTDLRGVYVRNGPNPAYAPEGRYHWFDGDGMLHAVRFEGGRASYRNRYIRTAGLAEERAAGRAVRRGIREPIDPTRLPEPWKDTSNTDVRFFGGALLTSWWLTGRPHRVDPLTLETLGVESFGGAQAKVSAHVKVDPATGELLFFEYGPLPPFMRFGVADASGRHRFTRDVRTPGPRLPHDMAFTRRFAVLMDLPVFPDPAALAKGRFRSGFHPDVPSRFALVPRDSPTADVRWFEASPAYIYHSVNAWDEGDAVVLVAHRVNPRSLLALPRDATEFERMMHNLTMDAELYRYRFDLATGRTTEEKLDDRNTEFPTIDARVAGTASRFGYAMDIPRTAPLAFRGLVKYDLATGASERADLPEGAFASEASFAPREGSRDEDDGYLVTFVANEADDRSEVWIYDARALRDGPRARLGLSTRVPRGFHACWVGGDELDATTRA